MTETKRALYVVDTDFPSVVLKPHVDFRNMQANFFDEVRGKIPKEHHHYPIVTLNPGVPGVSDDSNPGFGIYLNPNIAMFHQGFNPERRRTDEIAELIELRHEFFDRALAYRVGFVVNFGDNIFDGDLAELADKYDLRRVNISKEEIRKREEKEIHRRNRES